MSPPEDKFAVERKRMVRDQLERRGVRSARVLNAMTAVPREHFFPAERRGQAYHDAAYPVDCGQTISQPYMVAHMTELLNLAPTDRVLEIGTGTGYQTAILTRLAASVFTIEAHAPLRDAAEARLRDLSVDNVAFTLGDGTLGWPEQAPFDAILVTAGAPRVPPSLTAQLADGGRLVIPVGSETEQTLLRVTRTAEGLSTERGIGCRFVRLVGAEGWS